MNFEDYRATPGVNWSTLKYMAKSPLHYRQALLEPKQDKVSLMRGRAVHTAVLEPEKFALEYAIYQGKTRRGKEWDEFVEENQGKTILKVDEYDKCRRAAQSVWAHSEAKVLLSNGVPEQSFTWLDKTTGLQCKCRVDSIGEALIDLKTTSDIDARKFGNLAARMMYHGQLAFYNSGAAHKGEVFIIAVEAEPPFDCAVFQLGEEELYAGQDLYIDLLKQVQVCQELNVWPGRYPRREKLYMPTYVYEDEDQLDGTSVIIGGQSIDGQD